MSRGLDANQNLAPHAKCIKDLDYLFCARYIKRSPSALTHAEAVALSTAGLYIVSVVEIGSPTSAGYFSHTRGVEDGDFAFSYARDHLKQPTGSALYFTVDYNAALADLKGPVTEYFKGILSVLPVTPSYHVGVYGSGLCCSTILKGTAVTHSWLSMSKGWRGSRSFTGWNINQLVGETVCEVSVDTDVSNGSAGGWRL